MIDNIYFSSFYRSNYVFKTFFYLLTLSNRLVCYNENDSFYLLKPLIAVSLSYLVLTIACMYVYKILINKY